LEVAVTLQQALPFIIPLAILQLALMGVGLYDLTRPDRQVRGGSKLVWGVVIVLGELIGPLVYFFFGREDV
jgi:phospholipase D-like protein